MTRIGIVISWVLGYVVAFYFERMLALWVFLSTLLTSTVLMPVLLGIFRADWRKPLAGFVSAVTGLVSAILFYGFVEWFGTFSEENGTTILTIVTESGATFDIWQEYAMLVTLPLSLAGFFVGLAMEKRGAQAS
jgi:1,4-dihydroxy-2-naphthoate octaprenyltransferase